MKNISIVILVLFLGGCISVPNSPTPRFYMLQSIDRTKVIQKFNIASNLGIEVGPIKIPEYQDRPQMVTINKAGTLAFAEFDRWGESLDLSLARLINEDFAIILPGASFQMFPSNLSIPIKYQVMVDVLQIDSELDKDIFFVAQWSLIDVENNKMVFTKRSELRQVINPHNYAGLAGTLSAVCGELSSEIAEKIASLATKPSKP